MSSFQEVKEQTSIKDYADTHLEKSRGGFYCCPHCGSGTHGTASSDGALSLKGEMFKCFSCGRGGDIFELAGLVENTEDKAEQLQVVAAWAGIETKPRVIQVNTKHERSTRKQPNYTQGQKRHEQYIKQAQEAFAKNPEALNYWKSRGFTEQEAEQFGIGYDAQKGRIVIPWAGNSYYHIDRDITGTKEGGNKYIKPKREEVGAQPLYNPAALKAKAFFIVEGVLDALAVYVCGFEAIATGGTGARSVIEQMQGRTRGIAIPLLDTDTPGKKATEQLCELLEGAGIAYVLPKETPDYTDAAEHLAANPEGLAAYLEKQVEKAEKEAEAAREKAYKDALQAFNIHTPLDIAARIYSLEDACEPIPTGFENLDTILGGGLVPGLYVLGAISSLGKTTLAVQMADQIAAGGRGVLFFTIEQGAKEIAAKSLARYIAKTNPKYSGITASEILSPTKREAWGEGFNHALIEACNAYGADVGQTLGIQEGREQPSVSDIEAIAKLWQQEHGLAPVIFIDYLQLMKAPSERDTDKQAVDKNVMKLRQLARDLQAPIVAISSLNRSSYNEGVTMDAFKESGAIEYGADVLLGLQPIGLTERLDETAAAKQRREAMRQTRQHKQQIERACELVILKNRHGRSDVTQPLTFNTLSSTFEEAEEKPGTAIRVI